MMIHMQNRVMKDMKAITARAKGESIVILYRVLDRWWVELEELKIWANTKLWSSLT